MDIMSSLFERLLEEDVGEPTTSPEEETTSNSDTALRNTLRIYGSLFLILFTSFIFLRKKHPKTFTIRNWVEDLKTYLAADQYGHLSWIWKLFGIDDMTMMNECGMDAICYVRVLEFGFKLACVGAFNAIWLMPVYYTVEDPVASGSILDKLTTGNVPAGSHRLVATVVAAYVMFGFTWYSILKEFEWFLSLRNAFLEQKLARNYAVYVRNIPEEYQNPFKLLTFFRQTYEDDVLSAHLAIDCPTLRKKVAEREKCINTLEHAINVKNVTGVEPKKKTKVFLDGEESLIDSLYEELKELNDTISKSIDFANQMAANSVAGVEIQSGSDDKSLVKGSFSEFGSVLMSEAPKMDALQEEPSKLEVEPLLKTEETLKAEDSTPSDAEEGLVEENSDSRNSSSKNPIRALSGLAKNTIGGVTSITKDAVGGATSLTKNAVGGATSLTKNAVGGVTSLLFKEDGIALSAGFITFRSLRAKQAALQMVQYPKCFAMEILEAPQPEDIFWSNVGKNHKELQVGKLISFAATAALCLFWTIPMAFISSLASIEGLKEIGFINDVLEDAPWLEPVLAQLAPLLIVAAKQLLEILLEILSMREGPVSGSVIQASAFSKMALFIIIQTFFVSAISGSVMSELEAMLRKPELIMELLAKSLPGQSVFFIQIILVDTTISLGTELLRVSPVAMAFVRKYLGPNLTEKERNTTWLGIRPLADPENFRHARHLSNTVLYFMIFFVYACIAPISSFFLCLCFFLMAAAFRHQFVYIYPTFPDSGGRLWVNLFGILPACMLISLITILGMILLKLSPIASGMMFPLIIGQLLFTTYINQQHFKMTEFLPAREAIFIDKQNANDGNDDFDFLRDQYLQPELRDKEKLPENSVEEDGGDLAAEEDKNSVISA